MSEARSKTREPNETNVLLAVCKSDKVGWQIRNDFFVLERDRDKRIPPAAPNLFAMAAAAYNAMGETVVRLYGSNDQLQFGQFQWFVADVTGKTVAAGAWGPT